MVFVFVFVSESVYYNVFPFGDFGCKDNNIFDTYIIKCNDGGAEGRKCACVGKNHNGWKWEVECLQYAGY